MPSRRRHLLADTLEAFHSILGPRSRRGLESRQHHPVELLLLKAIGFLGIAGGGFLPSDFGLTVAIGGDFLLSGSTGGIRSIGGEPSRSSNAFGVGVGVGVVRVGRGGPRRGAEFDETTT